MPEQIIKKRCTKCGIVKPLDCFTKRKVSKDGYHHYCKECTRLIVRASATSKVASHTDEQIAEIRRTQPFKACNRCKVTKPITEFHILRQRADSHDEWCKACRQKQYRTHVDQMTDHKLREVVAECPVKVCGDCGQTKPLTEFSICRETSDGRHTYCDECKVQRMQKYYRNTLAYRVGYRNSHKEHSSKRYRNYNEQLKVEVLTHYGNGKCLCVSCGESRLPCLSIDHINGGGRKHRESINPNGCSGVRFYKWLKDNNLPNGYQTLCMNCQFIKAFDRGLDKP